jgi:hypothetical protein
VRSIRGVIPPATAGVLGDGNCLQGTNTNPWSPPLAEPVVQALLGTAWQLPASMNDYVTPCMHTSFDVRFRQILFRDPLVLSALSAHQGSPATVWTFPRSHDSPADRVDLYVRFKANLLQEPKGLMHDQPAQTQILPLLWTRRRTANPVNLISLGGAASITCSHPTTSGRPCH